VHGYLGNYATLGLLLLFIAAGLVAARVFGGMTLPDAPVGWHVIVAACAVVGTLLVILRALTIDNASYSAFGSSLSSGVKWGGFLLFLAAIAESVFAFLAFRESGESVSFDRGTPDAPPPAAT
jgi:hypothetical protein